MRRVLLTVALMLLCGSVWAQSPQPQWTYNPSGAGLWTAPETPFEFRAKVTLSSGAVGLSDGSTAWGVSYASPLYTVNIATGIPFIQVSDTDNLGMAIGIDAGLAASGTGNIAIGNGALNAVTTGNTNSAIGKVALELCTDCYFNTAVGAGSQRYGTSHHGNTSVGAHALFDVNFTGSSNTAIGSQALEHAETTSVSVAIGEGALGTDKFGAANTAVGAGALYSNLGATDATAYYNTAVGRNAGRDNITGTLNTYLGHSAGFSSGGTDLTNTTCIGYLCTVTASNTVVLGNDAVTSVLMSEDGGATVTAAAFKVGANTGISGTVVVKGSDGNNCNIVFEGGIVTSETCP